jgi:hypothetical protein
MLETKNAESLSCKELVELVTEYLENTLPNAQRVQIELHLSGCDGCTTYLEQMCQTIAALGALKENDVSPDAQAKLSEAFRAWQNKN